MDKEYFQFYDGKKMGIKSMEDGVIIPAVYDFVEAIGDGFFSVTHNGAHAYFDTSGKVVLPFQNKYEFYCNFSEGLARVRGNEQWGYIDKTGKEAIELQFYAADDFSDGFAIVRNTEDKHGAIDKTGKLIIDYRFPVLTKFENGYATFGDLKTRGIIDKSGNIVVPQEYIHVGRIQNNKVKVQVKEGDNFKEGILTLGGSVEWNNNLDKANEFNLQRKQFVALCEELIREMYADGCPCEYQRFRNFIQWNKAAGFTDQEELFIAFSKHLEKSGDSLTCKSCGTTYLRKWEEYSIALQLVHVKITKTGTFKEKGAKVSAVIPVSLGFYGYKLEDIKKGYQQTDNETVIRYLREKSGADVPEKEPRTWLQKLFGN